MEVSSHHPALFPTSSLMLPVAAFYSSGLFAKKAAKFEKKQTKWKSIRFAQYHKVVSMLIWDRKGFGGWRIDEINGSRKASVEYLMLHVISQVKCGVSLEKTVLLGKKLEKSVLLLPQCCYTRVMWQWHPLLPFVCSFLNKTCCCFFIFCCSSHSPWVFQYFTFSFNAFYILWAFSYLWQHEFWTVITLATTIVYLQLFIYLFDMEFSHFSHVLSYILLL